MTKLLLPGVYGPVAPTPTATTRDLAAKLLRCASRGLARAARRIDIAHQQRRKRRPPELEFYAEAGAPEGALYLDGELIGYLPGVLRL